MSTSFECKGQHSFAYLIWLLILGMKADQLRGGFILIELPSALLDAIERFEARFVIMAND